MTAGEAKTKTNANNGHPIPNGDGDSDLYDLTPSVDSDKPPIPGKVDGVAELDVSPMSKPKRLHVYALYCTEYRYRYRPPFIIFLFGIAFETCL